jgi:hypothetical protein
MAIIAQNLDAMFRGYLTASAPGGEGRDYRALPSIKLIKNIMPV